MTDSDFGDVILNGESIDVLFRESRLLHTTLGGFFRGVKFEGSDFKHVFLRMQFLQS